MGRRSDHSRAELEELILGAGEAHLAEVGFSGFSAREVAKRIGYSIGTIYNVFGSYDRLILAINARTLRSWAAFLEERLAAGQEDRIATLVHGYFDFAAQNRNRWMALYDHRMADRITLPEEFTDAFTDLVRLLQAQVAAEQQQGSEAEVLALTGSLVAIAHGHCMFELNGTYEMFGDWSPRDAALARIRDVLVSS
jgi:AcrR family transcriptional regulator